MTPPVLQCEKLTKDYGRFRALESLDLEVAPGEVFGLLGPNGSGKSTALRMVLGFLRPTVGSSRVAGFDCWRDSVEVRRRLTYLPGELRLYENMTGLELVRFLARLRGGSIDGDVTALARQFDVDLARPLVQLSSGMKRKVALLAVLVPRVPLVILDEPTNALDPTMRAQLLDLIRAAKGRGQAVVFSSHVLPEVEAVCDRVGILRLGRLVHLQSMDELRREKVIWARLASAPAGWPDLPGVTPVTPLSREVAFEVTGPPGPLFAWLGTQTVEEVRVEPTGLHPVYLKYHGADA
jgi:ABC-2 type transport system ATP-binding protein